MLPSEVLKLKNISFKNHPVSHITSETALAILIGHFMSFYPNKEAMKTAYFMTAAVLTNAYYGDAP